MNRFMDQLIWIVSIFALIALFISCGNVKDTAGRKIAEKMIESSAANNGQKVKVDLNKGSMKIVSNDGKQTTTATFDANGASSKVTGEDGTTTTFTSGSKAVIPADLPKDIPVYPGAHVRMSSANSQTHTYTVAVTTKDSLDQVTQRIKKDALANGWAEDTTVAQGGSSPMSILGYKKKNRSLDYMITKGDDGTDINITTEADANSSQ